MAEFTTSDRADDELRSIYIYGEDNFGERQADRYLDELFHVFRLLAEMPRMGRLAKTIGPGVRRHEHGSHVILYRETDAGVRILAVVHGRAVQRLRL